MIDTILVPTDGSKHANKALDLASDLAVGYGARLVILHVLLRDAMAGDLKRLIKFDRLSKDIRDEIYYIHDIADTITTMGGVYPPFPVPPSTRVLGAVGNEIAEEAREAAAARGVKDIRVEVIGGRPAKRILDAADETHADMIVMGSRGLGEVEGLFIGSVSHKVSHLSKCTCVTVK